MQTPSDLSAVRAADALADGDLTATALTQACLDRIAERDDTVRAWTHLDAALAVRQATARDAEPRRGRLHGLPVGVKDIIDISVGPAADVGSEFRLELPAG